MDKYNDNNFPIEGSNTGALYQEPKAEDYRAGGVSKIIYKARTNGNWKPFRVTDEQQIGLYFDTNSCTDFGYANSVEEQVTYLIDTKQLAGNALTWFQDNGYFDENGKFNISDRFNAILAGTTAEGNYINNPWEASRQYGMLPEKDLPSRLKDRAPWDFDDWINPKSITQAMRDKALESKKYLQVAYEWIGTDTASLEYHLKQAPVCILIPVCSPWNTTDIIQACSVGAGHLVVLDGIIPGIYLNIFDSYNPCDKRLAYNYNIRAAIKGIVEIVSNPLINLDTMIIQKQDDKKLYAVVGQTLIEFDNWEAYQKDFTGAPIKKISQEEFNKYKIAIEKIK